MLSFFLLDTNNCILTSLLVTLTWFANRNKPLQLNLCRAVTLQVAGQEIWDQLSLYLFPGAWDKFKF